MLGTSAIERNTEISKTYYVVLNIYEPLICLEAKVAVSLITYMYMCVYYIYNIQTI